MESVANIEARYSAGAHKAITLAGLAAEWRALAVEVADGYWGTIDDFTNDLSKRGLIEDAMTRLGEEDRAWLAALAARGDAAYQAVTLPDPDDRIRRYYAHDGQWWWRRIPRVLGELEADLGERRR